MVNKKETKSSEVKTEDRIGEELNKLLSERESGLQLRARQEADLNHTARMLERIEGGIITIRKLLDREK